MPEGLSAAEVGKEIGEHARHGGRHAGRDRHGRLISIAEAVLLSIVASGGCVVGILGSEVGHRLVAHPGQGFGDATRRRTATSSRH